MLVLESRRTRSLILRLDSGEILPAALQQALDTAEARAAWVTGLGTLEAVEIVLAGQPPGRAGATRRVEAPCEILSLTGNVAHQDGAGSLRLCVTLARETELGLEIFGGQLVWARCGAVELHVAVFDDIDLARAPDDRPRQAAPQSPSAPAETPRIPGQGVASGPSANAFVPREAGVSGAPPVPVRQKPREEPESYPEPGDLVNHFHFGECTIIESDGDRIRLRQEKDGRVRDVSLTMLRIEPPTVDAATGKRHFQLARKN